MKILIATDGSEFSRAAIDMIPKFFGNDGTSEFKIISVYETPAPMAAEPFAISAEYYAELENISKNAAQSHADAAQLELKKQFPDSNVSIAVARGNPAAMIVEEAKNWNADLIVVGSHGFGFWSRLMLGSVSNGVLHHAPCSVLVVRVPELQKP